MALKKPLVITSGQAQRLQSADALDYFKDTSVAYSGTLTLDTDTGDVITVGALTGNPTIGFTGTRARIIVRLVQDGTGGRVPSWGASVTYNAGVSSVEVDPAASAQTILTFLYNSTAAKYDIVASSYSASSFRVGWNKLTVGTSTPGSPTTGDLWVDTN